MLNGRALDNAEWPTPFEMNSLELLEVRLQIVNTVRLEKVSFNFKAFSNLGRLRRALVHSFRFVRRFRSRGNNIEKYVGFTISSVELVYANKVLVRIAQGEWFEQEIGELVNNKPLSNKSLWDLAPFLNESELLKVGVGFICRL